MLEKSYIHHLKALMCGINASRGQGHGHMFTMCHASLKMALLLHKVGLVSRLMSTTVVRPNVASKLGETRPLPQVLGTGRGWGEFYENILGKFGLGWEKPFWGQIVPLPENL